MVGIRDTKLCERLQIDSSLKLEKAKKAIRQAEVVQEQKTTTRSGEMPSLDAVRANVDRNRKSPSAHDAERGLIHKRTARQEMLSVASVSVADITQRCVSLRLKPLIWYNIKPVRTLPCKK